MPKGQPQSGDEGLDNTHTWGRTYWGGALFCFDADIEIRRQTKNKKGLQDALRGIFDAGGNITQDWELTKALKVGDQTTGTTVLTDLYNQMKDKPVTIDLQEIWKQLGIEWDGSAVHLRDDPPEAAIRRAIVGANSPAAASANSSAQATSPAATPTGSSAQPIAVLAGRKSS
jgi:predicted metalloprotease with PDZ domain